MKTFAGAPDDCPARSSSIPGSTDADQGPREVDSDRADAHRCADDRHSYAVEADCGARDVIPKTRRNPGRRPANSAAIAVSAADATSKTTNLSAGDRLHCT